MLDIDLLDIDLLDVLWATLDLLWQLLNITLKAHDVSLQLKKDLEKLKSLLTGGSSVIHSLTYLKDEVSRLVSKL